MTHSAPRSRYLVRDGVRLHYLDWGTEGRHPVVLVHGSRLHARVWNDFSRRFSDRYHIVAIDQRGHGDSAWAGDDRYELDDFCEDLRSVIEAQGFSRYTLVGHSLGGRVSMLYAHRHAAELERLILVDITPGRASAAHGAGPAGESGHQREFDSVESAAAYLRARMSRAPPELVDESVRNGLRQAEDGRYTWKYDPAILRRRAAAVDLWSLVGSIPTPTLLQYGGLSDVVSPELAARMAQSMARCTVERIEGAGHGLFTDQPEAFAASVERFVGDGRPPDAR